MWDLPRPGLKPVCPALAGGFLTNAPTGKPRISCWFCQSQKSVTSDSRRGCNSGQNTSPGFEADIQLWAVTPHVPSATLHHPQCWNLKKIVGLFPGGTVVKNPPANAGDRGSSPGPGRSHMLWSNEDRAPQLLSHSYWACSLEPTSHNYWARMPQLLKPTHLEPVLCNKRSHHNEKPKHCNEE